MTSVIPGESEGPQPESAQPDNTSLLATLTYGLSLPERTARSAAAIVAGLVHESAAHVIPMAFRSSRSYSVFIQQALDMMRYDVGGVSNPVSVNVADGEPATATTPVSDETILARKAVGGLLDVAGAATLHLSPITVLAIFNDIAYGSGHYLRKLSEELRREGIIDEDSSINHVADLIDALQQTSSTAVDAMEAPPINVQGVRELAANIQARVSQVDPTQLLPQREVARLWTEMEDQAAVAGTSVWDVSTAMTMFAMNRITLTTRGAISTVAVAGDLFDQHILSHYSNSLAEIREHGLYATLSTVSEPYLEAVWLNFDEDRETWTEALLNGSLFNRAWDHVRGWWGSSNKEPG